MECYFDNAATTAVFPEVKELMMTLLDVDYGNPSSQHKKGLTAKDYERTATEQVAKTLKCMPKEIVFTSGGTEANNLALIERHWHTAVRASILSRHRSSMRQCFPRWSSCRRKASRSVSWKSVLTER